MVSRGATRYAAAARHVVRPAGRLGDAVTGRALKHNINRRFEVDAVPNRNIDWPDIDSRPKHCPYRFIAVEERRPRAHAIFRLLLFPDETRFRAANARPIENDAHLASNPVPAWVGAAVPIDDDNVRFAL